MRSWGFRNSEWDNVFGGVLVFYLVATAWITARREEGKTGIVDVTGLLVALAIAALAAIYGIEAAQSPTGTKGRSAASDFVVPVAVATLAAIGDARILLRGGLRGAQRIARHLWRMCFALFIRFRSHIRGASAAISSLPKQNSHTLCPRYPATDSDGLLVGSRPVDKRI